MGRTENHLRIVNEDHRGYYTTQESLYMFLDEMVAENIWIINGSVSVLSKRFCSEERKREALQTIRKFTHMLGELYVVRALAGGDTQMKEKEFSLFHEGIEKYLADLGYGKENKGSE